MTPVHTPKQVSADRTELIDAGIAWLDGRVTSMPPERLKAAADAIVAELADLSRLTRRSSAGVKAEPVAWEGYWPGAGSINSETRLTRWKHYADDWRKEGAEIRPLGYIESAALPSHAGEDDGAVAYQWQWASGMAGYCTDRPRDEDGLTITPLYARPELSCPRDELKAAHALASQTQGEGDAPDDSATAWLREGKGRPIDVTLFHEIAEVWREDGFAVTNLYAALTPSPTLEPSDAEVELTPVQKLAVSMTDERIADALDEEAEIILGLCIHDREAEIPEHVGAIKSWSGMLRGRASRMPAIASRQPTSGERE
jgi:hypothetical protein